MFGFLNWRICSKEEEEWRLRLQRCRSKFGQSMGPEGMGEREFQTMCVNA